MDLIVRNGERRVVPSRVLPLASLIIEAGGTLEIEPEASNWAVFSVSGACDISGTLICRKFSSRRRDYRTQTPMGNSLSHRFFMDNIGGNGGDGNTPNPASRGGLGAFGDIDYGGGGGGAGVWQNGTRTPFPGGDAQRWRGGRSISAGYYGGDGGRRGTFSNGGLICIETSGTIEGNGTIDLRAERGADGAAKPLGGSGGGAPGGEGGTALLFASATNNDLNFLLDGGQGGSGGQGRYPGTGGEDGSEGFRNWL